MANDVLLGGETNPASLPILFDEKMEEHQVGWYRYANGNKKPVYCRSLKFTGTWKNAADLVIYTFTGWNIDKFLNIDGNAAEINTYWGGANFCLIGSGHPNPTYSYGIYCRLTSGVWKMYINIGEGGITNPFVRIYYTKTTDTAQ